MMRGLLKTRCSELAMNSEHIKQTLADKKLTSQLDTSLRKRLTWHCDSP